MLKRSSVLVLALALCASAAMAKEPWRWTAKERAGVRLDAAQRNARVQSHAKKQAENRGRAKAAEVSAAQGGDVIDGATNPELFFPTELFRGFVTSTFVTLPEAARADIGMRSRQLFTTDADWDRLAEVAGDYAGYLQRERQLLQAQASAPAADRARVDAELEKLRRTECPALAKALRGARAAFGRDAFDRFLYEVVAPVRLVTYSPGSEADVAALVNREEACQ
jgi:hypothetical protein